MSDPEFHQQWGPIFSLIFWGLIVFALAGLFLGRLSAGLVLLTVAALFRLAWARLT